MKALVRGSFASFNNGENKFLCDLNLLARKLLKYGETPRTLNDTKAFELYLLAEHYLELTKPKKKKKK